MKHFKLSAQKLILITILFCLVMPLSACDNSRDWAYKNKAVTELKNQTGQRAILKKLRSYHWLKKNYVKSVTLNYATAEVFSDWYHDIGPSFSVTGYINNDPNLKIEIDKDKSDPYTGINDSTSGNFKVKQQQFCLHIISEKLHLQKYYRRITNSQRLEAYAYHNKQSLQKIINNFAWKKPNFVKKINFRYETAADSGAYGNVIQGYLNGDEHLAFSVGLRKSHQYYFLNKNGNLWSENVQKIYKWDKDDFVVAPQIKAELKDYPDYHVDEYNKYSIGYLSHDRVEVCLEDSDDVYQKIFAKYHWKKANFIKRIDLDSYYLDKKTHQATGYINQDNSLRFSSRLRKIKTSYGYDYIVDPNGITMSKKLKKERK
ncbi:hypothetical protein PT285_09605 [Lactobacillus sp. ESL0791]|uniref:hypothetical protein n=1 Tax=Lactobacillus sp. ESL0791 TaxID=2983234 RepID=UPI0023F91CD8|nr:hypothetical protein [Lactobacillus sp. ESL0791]MDF7639654.1 hypothetical protein [Lactobacillus sp. ESL0791]